jgi:hypothetical protein
MELRQEDPATSDLHRYPGAPRWVKVTAISAGVVVLIFVALLHAGVLHGPGLHGLHGDHRSSGQTLEHTGHR